MVDKSCQSLQWWGRSCHGLQWWGRPCHGLQWWGRPCHGLQWWGRPCHGLQWLGRVTVSNGGVGRVTVSNGGVNVSSGGKLLLRLIDSSMSLSLVKIEFCVSCICFCAASTISMRESRQSTV